MHNLCCFTIESVIRRSCEIEDPLLAEQESGNVNGILWFNITDKFKYSRALTIAANFYFEAS